MPHQGAFIQAPYLFPAHRFHFLVAGYGSGKTSSLATQWASTNQRLQGKKSREGHNPRLLLGGVTLGHLEKTTLAYIKEDLDNSGTKFTHDKKNNRLTVGNVTTILVSLSAPQEIMGFDCCAALCDEIDDLGHIAGDDVTFNAVKAVNERARQVIPDFRKPFLAFACLEGNTKVLTKQGVKKIKDIRAGEFVLTRKGFREVKKAGQTNDRQVFWYAGVQMTPEHRVFDDGVWKCAQSLDKSSLFTVYSKRRIQKWLEMQEVKKCLLSCLMELSSTGIGVKENRRGITEQVLRTAKQFRYIVRFGRKLTGLSRMEWKYTIKILTQLITVLKILSVCRQENIKHCIGQHIGGNGCVLCADKSLVQKVYKVKDVVYASRMKEENNIRNVIEQLGIESIKMFGRKRLGLRTVLIAVFRLIQRVLKGLDVVNARKSIEMSLPNITQREIGLEKDLDVTPVCAACAESVGELQSLLDYVARVVEINLNGLAFSEQKPPNSKKRYALAARFLDAMRNGLRKNARSVPVYDLEVDMPDGDEGEFCVKGYCGFKIVHNSTSQGQKGLYRVITNFKKAGVAYTLIRGRTADNWYLDPEYVESLYQIYTPQERLVYLEGMFLALAQGRVFGDFDWDRNFVNIPLDMEVGQNETIYWTQDFNKGYHRGCAAILRGNIIYIVKRYEFPDIRQAPKVLRVDFPRNKILWIPDTTAKDQITQFTRELHKHGIWWVTRGKNPNVEDSAFVTNKLLYTSRLICTQAAKDTAEALSLAQRDKNNQIPKGIGPSSPIHDTDCVRMLCYFLCVTQRALLDIRKATIQRHLDHVADEPAVVELTDGYAAVNPEAFG